jgi:hypothetical protein
MTPDLQTFCLIALGVGFLILFAALLLLQVLRGSIFGLGMMFMRLITEGKEEPSSVKPQSVDAQAAYTPTDLRSRAQSLDFDAAVAKYRQEKQPPPSNPASPIGGLPPPNVPPEGEDQGGGVWPQ